MGNKGTSSTEPVLNNTLNETVSQVSMNTLNETVSQVSMNTLNETVLQVSMNTLNETVSQVCNNLNENKEGSPFFKVNNYKLENPKNITIGHLNVNSLRNKIISTEELIKFKLDIFQVSETKIDHSFPNQQFSTDGCKIYRRDRNNFGGCVLFYENENIPCRELTVEHETIFLEITSRTRKWLINRLYKLPNQKAEYFLKKSWYSPK